jgi:hypothetical protein
MSLDDFLAISPSEFSEIYASWLKLQETKEQNDWNRARWIVFKTLCPPDKKSINIFDIERFAWDPKAPVTEKSTRERFDELTKKYGKRLQTGNRNTRER